MKVVALGLIVSTAFFLSAPEAAACDVPLANALGEGKFQSEAASMSPEARQTLKKIILKCSVDTLAAPCSEAVDTFDLEYSDRFPSILMTIRGWLIMQGSMEATLSLRGRKELESLNYFKRLSHRNDLKRCLMQAYRAGK